MEKYYALIKDNRIVDIIVFESQNDDFANQISLDKGLDSAVWLDETRPVIYSTWDGSSFEPPTNEYLVSIGVSGPTPLIVETTS